MIDLLEICRRAETGPLVGEEAFDLDWVFMNAHDLASRNGIEYDPKSPVPSDDDLADRVFRAGVEVYTRIGTYCKNTGRVIIFTRDEIEDTLREQRRSCVLGEGADERQMTPRKPDSRDRPWCHVGSSIVNTTEALAGSIVYGYGRIPRVDSVSVPAFDQIDGHPVCPGSPTEILGSIRAMQTARAALERAGRPGLAIANCIGTAATALGTIAASCPGFGLRASDGWLISCPAELKINNDLLNKICFLKQIGGRLCGTALPMVGGYAGGPAETAIVTVAYILMGRMVVDADYHLNGPIDLRMSCGSNRPTLWTTSVASQAISRNTDEPFLMLAYTVGGPMTKQCFMETAACIAAAIASGASTQSCHPARALFPDHMTPMEGLAAVEFATGCAANGLSRKDANGLVNELLKTYEHNLERQLPGKPYQECFDPESAAPQAEYLDFYGYVRDELRQLGYPIADVPVDW